MSESSGSPIIIAATSISSPWPSSESPSSLTNTRPPLGRTEPTGTPALFSPPPDLPPHQPSTPVPSQPPQRTGGDVSASDSHVSSTTRTALIILGITLPLFVMVSTAFWCWFIMKKRRRDNSLILRPPPRRHGTSSDTAFDNVKKLKSDTLTADPRSRLSQPPNVRIANWLARSNSQRSATSSADTNTTYTSYHRSRATSPSLYPFSLRSESPDLPQTSVDVISITDSESMYSQTSLWSSPSIRSSHSRQSRRSSRYQYGSSRSSTPQAPDRHIYADPSLAVGTRPTRLSIVREDEV
ncbi:hypothetical protein PM082_000730 [Marasmius tenuissimus]|nr:hypothetical protein PM082_000730 [Marasmius tenuissimus]